MISSKTLPTEIARGLLLLGVFHIHAMFALLDHLSDPSAIRAAWLQIKVLAPHVVLFFTLSGMTSKGLGHKTFSIVANRSLMLMLVAIFSHIVGIGVEYGLWKEWTSAYGFFKEIVKPIVYGTGYSTFVAWFFVVLAITRVFAFFLAWNRLYFLLVIALAALLVAATVLLKFPDNVYEWRNWPAALLMFLLGTRIPDRWRVPHWMGFPAVVAGLALTYVNRPALLTEGLCLGCDAEFFAEPMIGRYGTMPVYFLQELLIAFGLLWICRILAATPAATLLIYVGRRSAKLLVLHGWIILSVYGAAAFVPPHWTGPSLFLAVFAANTLVHILLCELLKKPLDRFMSLCSTTASGLTALSKSMFQFTRPAREPASRA